MFAVICGAALVVQHQRNLLVFVATQVKYIRSLKNLTFDDHAWQKTHVRFGSKADAIRAV